ncbi:MAG: hypothetical protein PHZ00_03020 [Candidatus Peribacteraceae bacterium]|nr:hypothetical protein [Candidatus Peribacteraceae bacterium]
MIMMSHTFFSGHPTAPLSARSLMYVDCGLLFKGRAEAVAAAGAAEKKEAPAAAGAKKAEAEAAKKVDAEAAKTGDAVKAVVPETGDTSYKPTFEFLKWNGLHDPVPGANVRQHLVKPTLIGAGLMVAPPAGIAVAGGFLAWKYLKKLPILSKLNNAVGSAWGGIKNYATVGYNTAANIVQSPLVAADYVGQKIVRGLSTPLGLKGPDGQANTSALALGAYGVKHLAAAPFRAIGGLGEMAKQHPVWATAIAAGALQAMGIDVAGWVGGIGKSIVTSMFA